MEIRLSDFVLSNFLTSPMLIPPLSIKWTPALSTVSYES